MKKVGIISIIIAVLLASAAMIIIFKDKIFGNIAEKAISSYLDSSESVREWRMDKAVMKGDTLVITGLSISTVNGQTVYAKEISMPGFDYAERTADALIINTASFTDNTLVLVCDTESVQFNNVDFTGTQELLIRGNAFAAGYPFGFSDVKITNSECNMNNVTVSIPSISATGPFIGGKIPVSSMFVFTDIKISSMEGIINIDIPRMAGNSRYDEAAGVYTFTYEPVELVNYFIMEMDVEMADYYPNEFIEKMHDIQYDPLQSLKFSYIRLKLTDKGMADRFFSSVGIMFGSTDVNEVKKSIIEEIRGNTVAFVEGFENGKAIQNAIIEYVNNPVSIEFEINPPEPMTLNFSDEIIPYIAEYNMTMSVNGNIPIAIR